MEYSSIDPKVYGIKIRSTQRTSTSDDASNKKGGDKGSGSANNNSPAAKPSLATPAALHTASNASQSIARFAEGTRNRGVTHTTALTPLPTVVPPPTHESASTNQQEKLEAQRQPLDDTRKRKRRQNIAKKLGHEVDSDGEREYLRELSDRLGAEEARRQALTPEARRQENIEAAAKTFRDHIKPQLIFDSSGSACLYHYPLFKLQLAPDSHNGATCRLPDCTDRIAPGQYRIAVSPGSWYTRAPGKMECLQKPLPFYSVARKILRLP